METYRHLLHQHKPNAYSIHRPELVPLLAFALNCISNVLVVWMKLDTLADIQLFHVRISSVVHSPSNSPEYYSNCQSIALCIHMFRCQCNAFVLIVKKKNFHYSICVLYRSAVFYNAWCNGRNKGIIYSCRSTFVFLKNNQMLLQEQMRSKKNYFNIFTLILVEHTTLRQHKFAAETFAIVRL